jgi:hypothetical protein
MSRSLLNLNEDDLVAIIRAQFDMRMLAPLPGAAPITTVNTAMGQFSSQTPSGFSSSPPVPPGTSETKEYFLITPPRDYFNNLTKKANFALLFGAKALAMLNVWGVVEGHKDSQYRPTADQIEFFREDGTRAYFIVSELQEMGPDSRRVVCQFTDEVLLMFSREDRAMKLWTTKTAGVLAINKPNL